MTETALVNNRSLFNELIELRRELHKYPEVGLHLPKTQEKLLSALNGLGLKIETGKACSSITAVLEGEEHGPTVLLRADMDALPLDEDIDADYISQVPGAMHACGHDLHMAALVGAAKILNEKRAQLHGNVIFIFQPGEEGCDGAQVMLDEGVLEASSTQVVAAYALHVFGAKIPAGHVHIKAGPIMSAADSLFVRITGQGGHGSTPHLAKDPVAPLGEIITSIQTFITRHVDVFDPAVISIGRVRA